MASKNKRTRSVTGNGAEDVDRDVVVAENPSHEGEPPKKKQRQQRSLYISNLPTATTNDTILAHFSQSYPVKHATAVLDPETRNCKGFGFVTFADEEDAQNALKEFSGSTFAGVKIRVKLAEARVRKDKTSQPDVEVPLNGVNPRSQPSKRDPGKGRTVPKLIIRNLPWSIKTPEELTKLFLPYGKIKNATLPTTRPGTFRGFGFVVPRGMANAEKAMQGVNGKVVDGRTLAVDWAVDKDTWTSLQGAETDAISEEAAVLGSLSKGESKAQEHNIGDSNEREIDNDEDMMDVESHDDDDNDDNDEDDDEMWEDNEDVDGEEFGGDRGKEDLNESCTLFVRNLPFTVADEELQEHFEPFGKVRYARIVLDPSTERPKGTGFVCFFNPDDAQTCLRNAPKPAATSTTSAGPTHSVLENTLLDPSGSYTISGRILHLSQAVDRSTANKLATESQSSRDHRDRDKRRLYLLSEGTIASNSPLHEKLSSSEVAMREASLKQRKQLIQTNPSLHLSLTRLSVRNIPRSIGSKELKQLGREAVVGFATDVKQGTRERLSKEELSRGGKEMADAEKLRKTKGTGIVRQAKVVFEGREGSKIEEKEGVGRSRGYGFIEYYTHRSALMGLRWMNGHAVGQMASELAKSKKKTKGKAATLEEVHDRKKRLIVEFAIENAQVVHRRMTKESKSRQETGGDGKKNSGGNKAALQSQKSLFNTVKVESAQVKRSEEQNGKKVSKAVRTKVGRDLKEKAVVASQLDKEKLAQRQRIISKKRAQRRDRKRTTKR